MMTPTTPVLFKRLRHYWWNSWSWGSWMSQRSITFLMVVVGNIKISRTSFIYIPIKRTFPSKQSGFYLQLATGNHHVMELVVQWNAMLQNEVCRDHSTTKFWTIVQCWKYAKKKWDQLSSLAMTKKTWLRWERRWRGLNIVRQYPLQEAVIISFPSQHHKFEKNCVVRMTHLILATLHHRLTSLACTIYCGGTFWWTKLMMSKVM